MTWTPRKGMPLFGQTLASICLLVFPERFVTSIYQVGYVLQRTASLPLREQVAVKSCEFIKGM